ncbi:hypothetical protein OC709_00035 ['Planchonia careya' phytoplasma]|nr:hypothetical protein ['Planchonia careya' phytoplasma]MDO8029913.1 hypothetical protein ['Planchonia careya' phytoplasma]
MLKLIKNNILFFSIGLTCLLTIFTINNVKMSIKAYDKDQYFDQVVSSAIDKKEKILSLTQYNIIEDTQDIQTHPVKIAVQNFINYIFQDEFGIEEWKPSQTFTKFKSDNNLPTNYYTTILPDEINREFITVLFAQIKTSVSTQVKDEVLKFLSTQYIGDQIVRAINFLLNT